MSRISDRIQEVIEGLLEKSEDGLVRTHEVKNALAEAGFEVEFPIDSLVKSLGFEVIEGFVCTEDDYDFHQVADDFHYS